MTVNDTIESYRKRRNQLTPLILGGVAVLLVVVGIIIVVTSMNGGGLAKLLATRTPTPTITPTQTNTPMPTDTPTITPTPTDDADRYAIRSGKLYCPGGGYPYHDCQGSQSGRQRLAPDLYPQSVIDRSCHRRNHELTLPPASLRSGRPSSCRTPACNFPLPRPSQPACFRVRASPIVSCRVIVWAAIANQAQ